MSPTKMNLTALGELEHARSQSQNSKILPQHSQVVKNLNRKVCVWSCVYLLLRYVLYSVCVFLGPCGVNREETKYSVIFPQYSEVLQNLNRNEWVYLGCFCTSGYCVICGGNMLSCPSEVRCARIILVLYSLFEACMGFSFVFTMWLQVAIYFLSIFFSLALCVPDW